MEGSALMGYTPINETFGAKSGSHILYVYSDSETYVENAALFIQTAFELEQHVVLIETPELFARIRMHLLDKQNLSASNLARLHYVNAHEYYGSQHNFESCQVIENFEVIARRFHAKGRPLRMWGHVIWKSQPNIETPLREYEDHCGVTAAELGYTTVCAYDGHTVPSYIQTTMMQNHEYLMTDHLLTPSNFYKGQGCDRPVVFPSLFHHRHLESRADLHEQKMDFLHVVSHEVRNPLAVIEGFAMQLKGEERDETRKGKLETIRNHAKVIDYEITHLIATEELLSTNGAWSSEPVQLLPLVLEVAHVSGLKAQTQNMQLAQEIELDGSETVVANIKGLQLVLFSLLNNAIQYGREGQTILLRVGKTQEVIILQVTDCGIGMTKDQVGTVFRRSDRTNREIGGLGQSLHLVYQLVLHFGGTISVLSQLNIGSTFRVEIPLAVSVPMH